MVAEDRVVRLKLQDRRERGELSSPYCFGSSPAAPLRGCSDITRSVRIKVLDAIVTCLEYKKPGWQKGRILHLSTQLEESMSSSAVSMAAYGDPTTLETRINQHCLLLAKRKKAGEVESNQASGRALLQAPLFSAEEVNPSSTIPAAPRNALSNCSGRNNDGRCSRHRTLPPVDVNATEAFDLGGHTSGVPKMDAVPELDRVYAQDGPSGDQGELSWATAEQSPKSPKSSPRTETYWQGAFMPKSGLDTLLFQGSAAHGFEHVSNGPAHRVEDDRLPDSAQSNDVRVASKEPSTSKTLTKRGIIQDITGGRPIISEEHQIRLSSPTSSSCWETSVDGGPSSLDGTLCVDDEECRDHGDKEVAKQHALRLFQCRVLLLKHASSCTEENGDCQLSPLCDSVRQLLHHIQACDGRATLECQFPHCSSSKAVLHHQQTCQDAACYLCKSVREISQKCFWANARHAHKRRLQESQELRRMKRLKEGKLVAAPRKQQTDRKSARETCAGLDEAGNHLGDISLGFFLRQDRAVKARKRAKEGIRSSKSSTQSSTGDLALSTFMDESPKVHGSLMVPEPRVRKNKTGVVPTRLAGVDVSFSASTVNLASRSDIHQITAAGAAGTSTLTILPSLNTLSTTATQATSCGATVTSNGSIVGHREQRGTHVGFSGTGVKILIPEPAVGSSKPVLASSSATKPANVVSDGLPAPLGGKYSHSEGRRCSLIPEDAALTTLASSGVSNGHLKTSPEAVLDEIAVSLRDTTRQPSFTRIQSVQAFLDEHGELRESPSFGDVYALVDQWSGFEEGAEDDHLILSSAISF